MAFMLTDTRIESEFDIEPTWQIKGGLSAKP